MGDERSKQAKVDPLHANRMASTTAALRRRIRENPSTPPQFWLDGIRDHHKIRAEYIVRLRRCKQLDQVIFALALAKDAQLKKYTKSISRALTAASDEYKALWVELVEMSKFPDDKNPYLDRDVKKAHAKRTRVRLV